MIECSKCKRDCYLAGKKGGVQSCDAFVARKDTPPTPRRRTARAGQRPSTA